MSDIFYKMDDLTLYFQEFGKGDPFVMLHGNGESSSFFDIQHRLLSKYFKLIAIDTRGHGQSPKGKAPFTLNQFAEDLHLFLQSGGFKKIHLMGFSDGANIAMIFALKYPQFLKSLILNSGNLYPEGMKPNVVKAICREYDKLTLLPDSEKTAHERSLLSLMMNEPHISADQLAKINVPTLVIAGDNDMILKEHTELIAHSIAGSTLRFIEGDHFIAYKEKDAFDREVIAFEKDNDFLV